MTAPAVVAPAAAEAEAEDARRTADATARLSQFLSALHTACTAPDIRPRASWPWTTRMQEAYNERQDAVADALLDQAQAELEAIDDPLERCLTAEAWVKAADAYCVGARYRRDIGLIVMLFQHYDGWRRYLLAKRAIDRALDSGEIDAAEHGRRQSEIGDTRRSERSGARWRPTSAGALARVSRGLINSQIKHRIPASLGESLRGEESMPEVPTPSMEEAEGMAERHGREVRYCSASVPKAGGGEGGEATVVPAARTLRNVAQDVRNAAIDEILSGSPDSGLGWPNVDLANILGISGARVAQLRRFEG